MLVFSACEKEEKNNEDKPSYQKAMVSANQLFNICCEVENICSECTSLGYCCCRIFVESNDPLDIKFKYCKPWDTSPTCEIDSIPNTNCRQNLVGIDGDLCIDDNFICIPNSTGFSIYNTSLVSDMLLTINCGSSITYDTLEPQVTRVYNLFGTGGCNLERCKE